jgi:hypothetical protein
MAKPPSRGAAKRPQAHRNKTMEKMCFILLIYRQNGGISRKNYILKKGKFDEIGYLYAVITSPAAPLPAAG